MFCPSCGAPNADSANVCVNCGQALISAPAKPRIKIWNRIGIVGGLMAAIGFFLPWNQYTGYEQFLVGLNFLTSGETGDMGTMIQVYTAVGLITILLPAVFSLFALAGTRGTVVAMRLAAVLPLIALVTYITVLFMWLHLDLNDFLAQHQIGFYLTLVGTLWMIFTPDPRRNK